MNDPVDELRRLRRTVRDASDARVSRTWVLARIDDRIVHLTAQKRVLVCRNCGAEELAPADGSRDGGLCGKLRPSGYRCCGALWPRDSEDQRADTNSGELDRDY